MYTDQAAILVVDERLPVRTAVLVLLSRTHAELFEVCAELCEPLGKQCNVVDSATFVVGRNIVVLIGSRSARYATC
jgi:siroheme synthase (precorrin-2 oxidase/ferrochelatase)